MDRESRGAPSPPAHQAGDRANSRRGDTKEVGDLLELVASVGQPRHLLTLERADLRRPPVHGLLVLVSPSAVTGLVVSVDVDAVERVAASRPPAHVGKEVLELLPCFTD